MIKALIFDLDDTLFPERQFVLSGFRAVSRWLSENYALDGGFETFEVLFLQGFRGNIFDLAMKKLGLAPRSDMIKNMVDVYRNHKPEISLYEDAAWAVEYFGRHKMTGIITDGYLHTQRNKVAALNIEKHLDTVIFSDELGRDCWKPSQVPYLKAMEVLGCSGEECVYVGDNPSKDFISAKSLGWSTVQICRPHGEYRSVPVSSGQQADFNIETLFDLERLFNAG